MTTQAGFVPGKEEDTEMREIDRKEFDAFQVPRL